MILILSSLVAASAVGGGLQTAVFARAGLEAMLVPTVLFGRHPGLGAPGGGPTPTALFAGMLEGVAATGALGRLEAVVAGYFASAEQVGVAARAIEAARVASPAARIVVDPIMGDEPKGLYVAETVAAAIARDLVPRADLLTPNLWELRRLVGEAAADPLAAARSLGRPTLASSIDLGEEIGILYSAADQAWLAAHARLGEVPRGAGDRLAAIFTAALIKGRSPPEALAEAARGLTTELSIPTPVRLERLA